VDKVTWGQGFVLRAPPAHQLPGPPFTLSLVGTAPRAVLIRGPRPRVGARLRRVRSPLGQATLRNCTLVIPIPHPPSPIPHPPVKLQLGQHAVLSLPHFTFAPLSGTFPPFFPASGRGATASRPFAAQRPSPGHPSVLRNLYSVIWFHLCTSPLALTSRAYPPASSLPTRCRGGGGSARRDARNSRRCVLG
jgi:hypothetical protein